MSYNELSNFAYAFSNKAPQNSGGEPNEGQNGSRPFRVGSRSSITCSFHSPNLHNRKRKNPAVYLIN